MASENYIPYNIRLDKTTSAGVWITWDIHPSAEYSRNTYYRVYISIDGGSTWSAPSTATRKAHYEPLKSSYFWVTVSSVVNGEESAKSTTPLMISNRVGDNAAGTSTTVAISELSGAPSKLLVDEDSGALKVSVVGGVSTDGAAIDTSFLAKDSTAQAIGLEVAKLAKEESLTSISTKVDSLAKDTSIQRIQSELDDWNTVNTLALKGITLSLDQLKTVVADLSSSTKLVKTESSQINVTPEGKLVTEQWIPYSVIDRITVIKEDGPATEWAIEIYDCRSNTTPRHAICREEYVSGIGSVDRLDLLKSFAYINTEGLSEITFRIIPNAGSNSFYVCITGTEARM